MIKIEIKEHQVAILRNWKGRSLLNIAALSLHLNKDYFYAPAGLCLVFERPEAAKNSELREYISIVASDVYGEARVYTELRVSEGVGESGIPLDPKTKIPGPCSWIEDLVRNFVFAEIQIVTITERFSVENCDNNDRGFCIESGILCTANDGRSFLMLAEQTGDLHLILQPRAELFLATKVRPNNYAVLGLGRKIFSR